MINRLSAVAFSALVLAASCSKQISGPTPTVAGVAPAAICQAQLTTTVQLSGAGLSPLYEGALATGKLDLPSITLGKVQDIGGVAMSGAPVPIPDDPTMPASSHVRWLSQQMMSFDVTPDLMLQTGLYDVVVANANGKSGTFPGGLLAVPPPAVTSLVTDLVCGEQENVLELSGDFFITTTAGGKPKVQVGTLSLDPSAVSDCRNLPGTSGLAACKTMKVTLLAGQLTPGSYPVKVTNPDPVGCVSTEVASLTVVPAPAITTLEPEVACSADGDVNVTITGTGFLNVDGHSAGVAFGAMSLPGKTDSCTVLPGPRELVNVCTKLTFAIPKNTPGGTTTVAVRNPDPVGCLSSSKPFTLFDRPVVTSVQPGALCSLTPQVVLMLTGSNFVTIAAAVPSVAIGAKTYVPVVAAASCTDVQGTTQPTKICTSMTVTVAPKDLQTGKQAVVVTNPAPVGCGSDGTSQVEITTPPVLTAVAPARVCAGDATLNLTGSNFAANATVTLNGTAARTVTVNAAGTAAVAAFGGGLSPGGPFTVTISNGSGCDASLNGAVTVVPGPQVFFVDPDVVYNGLNLQATVYGTGFTEPVTVVEMSLNGTNWTALT
ncbi:MAG TPA: hypothetical protein VNO55_29240, partial [Polyangia bacterium]|nr:hypothetical protein [Polyangia bacterium]